MYSDLIRKLANRLYPQGRAFKMPANGVLDRLHKALAVTEAQAYTDALSILDSTIADNANFTTADATDWERRLGIISSGTATSLADRKKAINLKLNYPGTSAPRQHYLYIQDQLQAAGFPVYVYENNFTGATKTPAEVLGVSTATLHDPTKQHKPTVQHGSTFSNKIVNYLEEEKDASFIVGSNYRSTFFITGATITTYADIPVARKDEFRQLILQLKPVQMVGFLFVNYV